MDTDTAQVPIAPDVQRSTSTSELNVDGFITAMDLYYVNERDRNTVTLGYLNDIFQCCPGMYTHKLVAGEVREDHDSDGHVLGPVNTIEVVLQVKNELGSSSLDPNFPHIIHCRLKTSQKKSDFFLPALGMVIIGQCRSAIDSSTWLLAFFVIISTRTPKFPIAKIESLPLRRDLPYVNEIAAHSTSGVIRFHIRAEAYQGNPRYLNRFLYLATLDGTGDNVHPTIFPRITLVLRKAGRAPQLLGYGNIPGSWHVVMMEFINQEDTNLQNYAPHYLSMWSEDLKSLVKDFHDKGRVHGDRRNANLIVSNQKPGEPGQQGDFQITMEHDSRVLAFTLKKLGASG
ncbi:hypothetical protein BJY52DRAFT_1221412 [Lactarius psammicola]|nr:hypothetical protein BJY52DRAFT_1221412 [Lactarius psammicola]